MKSKKQAKKVTRFSIKNIGTPNVYSGWNDEDRKLITLDVLIACEYWVSWHDSPLETSAWVTLYPQFIGSVPADVEKVIDVDSNQSGAPKFTDEGRALIALAQKLAGLKRGSSRVDYDASVIRRFFNEFERDYSEKYMTSEAFCDSRDRFLAEVRECCLVEARKLIAEAEMRASEAAA